MLPRSRVASDLFRSYMPSAPAALLAVVASAALFVSLQFSDDALCALLNVGLLACPFLLGLAVSGRPRAALAAASAVALLIWGLGELKLLFFHERLGLMDLYFLSQGANWNVAMRYPAVQWAMAGGVCLAMLLGVSAWRLERKLAPWGAWSRTLSVLLFAGWCAVAWVGRHHHVWEVFREDGDCGLDKICGVMSRLIYSYSAFEFLDPTAATDPADFLAAASTLAPLKATGAQPDVVVWLHESTFDPSQYRLEGARLPTMAMFQRSPRTQAAGLLRVHTFGGRTWLSEFSLLTGLVPADFGARSSLVFNSVAPKVSSTLVRRFAAAGYDSVVLMPTPREFYGAARTYAAVGFDRVLTLRDFPEYDSVIGDEWDISDSARLVEAAITLLREHRRHTPNRPLFLYLLSIKEHGPYLATSAIAYGLEGATRTQSLAARLTDYVTRLRNLDAALADLERELIRSPRRAMWAYFGDHQPNFEEAQPDYRYDLPDPDQITQYQVRANYPLPRAESPALLDIALLPSLIADGAGVPADPYFKAQSGIRRLCAGRLQDCPETSLVDSYKGYVFGARMALFEPRAAEVAMQMH